MDSNYFDGIISNAIDKAAREGQFDNLPGAGKPFDWQELGDNPFVPDDQKALNSILKNAGLAPGWVGERKEMIEQIEAARKSVIRTWKWVQLNGGLTDMRGAQQWARALKSFRSVVDDLNKRIPAHNLKLPDPSIALPLFDFDTEIAAVKKL